MTVTSITRYRASCAAKNISQVEKRFWKMSQKKSNWGGIKIVKNGVDGAELWQSCFTVFPSSQLSFLSHPHFTPDVSLKQKFKSPQFHEQYRLHGGMFWCGDLSLPFQWNRDEQGQETLSIRAKGFQVKVSDSTGLFTFWVFALPQP